MMQTSSPDLDQGWLPVEFFARPTLEVARGLIGTILVATDPSGSVSGRIVETEAYHQFEDPASHSFRGRTPRNIVMFGPPGRLYVYLSHGLHHCINVVTESEGVGAAVLIRAVEPLEGLDLMRARRKGILQDRLLASGPGRVAAAFGLTRNDDGLILSGERIGLRSGSITSDRDIATTPRIGIRVGLEHSWRFCLRGSPWLSRPIALSVQSENNLHISTRFS